MRNFTDYWLWKSRMESAGRSILDKEHIEETHLKLLAVLKKWQTYRNGSNSDTSKTLKEALWNIREEYDHLRGFSLLRFREMPKGELEVVWRELGRVKETEGRVNVGGRYYAVAATKPMLLLLGQTPAFDTKVRGNLPARYGVRVTDYKLSFSKWWGVMSELSRELKESTEFVGECEAASRRLWKDSTVTPFGRLIDVYFWVK